MSRSPSGLSPEQRFERPRPPRGPPTEVKTLRAYFGSNLGGTLIPVFCSDADTVGEFGSGCLAPRMSLPGVLHVPHLPAKRPSMGIRRQYPMLLRQPQQFGGVLGN